MVLGSYQLLLSHKKIKKGSHIVIENSFNDHVEQIHHC